MRLCLGVMMQKRARDEECSMWIYLIWLRLTNAVGMVSWKSVCLKFSRLRICIAHRL